MLLTKKQRTGNLALRLQPALGHIPITRIYIPSRTSDQHTRLTVKSVSLLGLASWLLQTCSMERLQM